MVGGQRCGRRRGCGGRTRGMTLVEVLIAVSLITLLSGALLLGPGMLGSSRQRAAATLILSTVRLAQARANTTGRPVRMVFDLDQHRLLLEQAAGSVMLREQESGTDEEATGAGADPATELEQAARAKADGILEGPRAPRAKFTPVEEFGADDDDSAPGRALGKGIQYRQVQTEHEDEPRTKGRAYLYFWPRGGTERAAVQLRRGGEEEGLTVMVSALTGRARIERGAVELPKPRFDDDEYSEREEP